MTSHTGPDDPPSDPIASPGSDVAPLRVDEDVDIDLEEELDEVEDVASAGTSFLGPALIVLGIAGLLATAAVIVLGLRMVDRTTDTLSRSLDVTGDAISVVEDSIIIAGEAMGNAVDGIDALQDAVDSTATSMDDATVLLTETAAALETDIPDSVDAIRLTMPALINSAQLIEDTLGSLAFLGVDFSPSDPPSASLREVDAGLEAVSTRLRDSASRLEDVGGAVGSVGESAARLGVELDDLELNLSRADGLLDGYETTAARTAEIVEQAATDLDSQRRDGRILVLLLGAIAGGIQLVPLALGWRYLQMRRLASTREAVRHQPY